MKSNFLFGIAIVLTSWSLTSCEKDDTTDITTFAEESIEQLESRTLTGRGACFELVFPITISFIDSTTADAENYEQLKQIIVDWKTNNPNSSKADRPTVVFPISVVTPTGETVVVEEEAELKQLKRDCKKDGKGHGKACFKFNYPVSVAYPDGTTTSYDTGKLLRQGLKAWKRANADADTRPQLVYPITVTLEDETIKTINSKEELVSLKESCD